MKTSNKILIIALLWFTALLVYDKYLCRKEFEKIDRTKYFGQYTTKQPLKSFKHIHIQGGNNARIYISKRDFYGLQHRDHLKGEFKFSVNNDTLYVKFADKHTGSHPQLNEFNSLIIGFKDLESVTVNKSYVIYRSEEIADMKFNIGKFSEVLADIKNMYKLEASVSKNSRLKFGGTEKSEIDTIAVDLKQYSYLDLKRVKFKFLDKKSISQNTKIRFWNRIENK